MESVPADAAGWPVPMKIDLAEQAALPPSQSIIATGT